MSQEYRVVPAALLESALKTLAGVAPGRFAVETELRAIVNAPLPPACGDPNLNRTQEQWRLVDAKLCAKQNSEAANEFLIRDAQYDIAILGGYVSRLQAENAVLQQRLNTADQRVDELQSESFEALYNAAIEERDAAQSELAKALELVRAIYKSGSYKGEIVFRVRELLAHQSAPAAKGEGDE